MFESWSPWIQQVKNQLEELANKLREEKEKAKKIKEAPKQNKRKRTTSKKKVNKKEKSYEEKKAMKRKLKQVFVNTTNFHFFERLQKNDYLSFQLSCFGKSKRNSRQPTSPCFRKFIFSCSIGYQEQNTELLQNDIPPTKKRHRPNSSEEKKGTDQNSGREKNEGKYPKKMGGFELT